MSFASKAIPALLLLAACAAQPPSIQQDVPLAMPEGAGDPVRAAVLAAAPAFANTAGLANRPAEAARLEWLAAMLVQQPDWRRASPLLGPSLRAGRAELRAALGVPETIAPAAAAAAMLGAARALETGQPLRAEAALDPVSGGQGGAALRRLAALPPLPRAAEATGLAQSELMNDGRWDLD